jgi:uncharacterized membrane protein YbhN (UPF0104 family)
MSRPSVRAVVSFLLFAAAIVAALYLFSRHTGGWVRFVGYARLVSPAAWVAAAASAAVFYVCDYLRLYCLLRICGIRLGVSAGLKLTCITYLVADLTPNSELYFPFVVFLLIREGVPGTTAAAVSMTKSLMMMLWVSALSYATLRLNPGVALPAVVSAHLLLYLTPLIIMSSVLAVVIIAPGFSRGLCARILGRSGLPGWLRKIVGGLDRTAQTLSSVGRSRDPMHLLCHAATLAAIAGFVGAGWIFCRALDLGVSLGHASAAFTNGLFLGYVSPVPGSIGIGEGIESYLLDPAMRDGPMAAAILHRVTCWYFIWLPGAVFLADLLKEYGLRLFAQARRQTAQTAMSDVRPPS